MTQSPDAPEPAADAPADLPVVRLKPKANARAIRRGFPWVFADELVTDRRTKALEPGTIAMLEDAERKTLGRVALNPKSKIIARMIDTGGRGIPDHAWFVARLKRALDLRERLYDAPFYRLVHAEADGLPGVVIDRFGDVAVIQPNAAWADVLIEPLAEALAEVTGVTTILKNAGGRGRSLEGLDAEDMVLRGAAPDAPLRVEMNGATYLADLTGGQKTGLFYDQRENQGFAARFAKGQDVLDVFSHVGGFALAALANGASSALAVDGSAPALDLARQGAEASGRRRSGSTRGRGTPSTFWPSLARRSGASASSSATRPPSRPRSRRSRRACGPMSGWRRCRRRW